MMRFNGPVSQHCGLLISAIAIGLLAGCMGQSSLTALPANLAIGAPDASSPPSCKGQKSTKSYGEVALQDLKPAGGSLCVPAFGGWGGALQYPGQVGSYDKYTAKLISSTTIYKGSLLPPAGTQKPLFYLQIGLNSFPGFDPTSPKGAPLVSTHLTPKKSYTVKVSEYFYALGWEAAAECYLVAGTSKYGGSLTGVGDVFDNVTFYEKNGALEIFSGALVSNKC